MWPNCNTRYARTASFSIRTERLRRAAFHPFKNQKILIRQKSVFFREGVARALHFLLDDIGRDARLGRRSFGGIHAEIDDEKLFEII